jgi:ferric-dicitrate binding protein FerR (iron transport regulator)
MTSLPDPVPDEFDRLTQLFLDGVLEERDADRLRLALLSDGVRMDRFVRAVHLHGALTALRQEIQLSKLGDIIPNLARAVPSVSRATRRFGRMGAPRARRRRWLFVAAAAIVAVGVGIWVLARTQAPDSIAEAVRVQGTVRFEDGTPAAAGTPISPGQGIRTIGAASGVRIAFRDGTWMDLGPDSQIARIDEAPEGKRARLKKGALTARVAKQRADRPMVFSTPHGEATVLGTTLRLVVDPDPKKGTKLDVNEGKVRLRNLAGRTVDVPGGHFAVAASGVDLAAKPLAPGPLSAAALVAKMPPDSWLSVPDTRMRKVVPDRSRYPNVKGSPEAVITGASGAALDPRRHRLVLWGGGPGYFGNELYAFDLPTLQWRRLTDPYPDPKPEVSVHPDGTPGARSTYNHLAYLAHVDRLFALGGAVTGSGNASCPETWTFDFETKTWENRRPSGPNPSAGFGCAAAYDPVTRKLWWGDDYHASYRQTQGLFSYEFETNAWTRHDSDEFYFYTSTIDLRRGRLVFVGRGEVFVYDVRGSGATRRPWKTTGGDGFIAKTNPGLDYDPVRDRIVGWHGGAVYALNPETGVWTAHDASGAPTTTANGVFGRWRYVPVLDAFVVVTGIDENVHLYRPR